MRGECLFHNAHDVGTAYDRRAIRKSLLHRVVAQF
jgi:hypothetical protein